MQRRKLLWRIANVGFLPFLYLLAMPASSQTLKQITTFDLPGPAGKRFDYLTIDEDNHYLISAHLAANQTY